MLDFDLSIPTKIFFGLGKIEKLGDEIKKYGTKVLLVYGSGSIKKNGIYDEVCAELKDSGIFHKELSGVKPNPRISSVREGINICRENDIDFILACGGGSTIDCSKAIAAGFFIDADPWELYSKRVSIEKALPLGTVLTLSAAGSEMNGYTVVSNSETCEKLATGSDLLRPKFSILDPSYTFTVPDKHTAAGVVDIFVHIMEQYFSPEKDAFVSDKLAEALFKVCIEYGPVILEDASNLEGRSNIMWAGSLALNSLLSAGKTGDWATHMIEHEVSAVYDISHGLGLAILAPVWMDYVLDDNNAEKFSAYARNVWGISGDDNMASAKEGIKKTREFFSSLGMASSLSGIGIGGDKLEVMAEKAVARGAIGGFKILNKDDVLAILKNAFK